MDLASQIETHWIWFGASLVLLALEAAFNTGFRFIAISLAATILGGLTYLYGHVGLPVQLLFFAALSAVFVWGARAIVREREAKIARLQKIFATKAYVGKEYTLTSPIVEHRGSLEIDDYLWQLKGDDAPAGAQIRVLEMGEGWLRVEPVI